MAGIGGGGISSFDEEYTLETRISGRYRRCPCCATRIDYLAILTWKCRGLSLHNIFCFLPSTGWRAEERCYTWPNTLFCIQPSRLYAQTIDSGGSCSGTVLSGDLLREASGGLPFPGGANDVSAHRRGRRLPSAAMQGPNETYVGVCLPFIEIDQAP